MICIHFFKCITPVPYDYDIFIINIYKFIISYTSSNHHIFDQKMTIFEPAGGDLPFFDR